MSEYFPKLKSFGGKVKDEFDLSFQYHFISSKRKNIDVYLYNMLNILNNYMLNIPTC